MLIPLSYKRLVFVNILFHKLGHGLILKILLIEQIVVLLNAGLLPSESGFHVNDEFFEIVIFPHLLSHYVEQLVQVIMLIVLQDLLQGEGLGCQV